MKLYCNFGATQLRRKGDIMLVFSTIVRTNMCLPLRAMLVAVVYAGIIRAHNETMLMQSILTKEK